MFKLLWLLVSGKVKKLVLKMALAVEEDIPDDPVLRFLPSLRGLQVSPTCLVETTTGESLLNLFLTIFRLVKQCSSPQVTQKLNHSPTPQRNLAFPTHPFLRPIR